MLRYFHTFHGLFKTNILYDTYSMKFNLKVETDNIRITYIAASQIG